MFYEVWSRGYIELVTKSQHRAEKLVDYIWNYRGDSASYRERETLEEGAMDWCKENKVFKHHWKNNKQLFVLKDNDTDCENEYYLSNATTTLINKAMEKSQYNDDGVNEIRDYYGYTGAIKYFLREMGYSFDMVKGQEVII